MRSYDTHRVRSFEAWPTETLSARFLLANAFRGFVGEYMKDFYGPEPEPGNLGFNNPGFEDFGASVLLYVVQ